jgi:hypothetical protein
MSRLVPLAVVALALTLGGCGPSACRVTGSVTRDGQPLAQGNIAFEPDGVNGPAAVVPVRGGRYDVPAGKELVPGHYKVRIGPAGWLGEGAPPASFPQYTTETDLTPGLSERNFDVPAAPAKP